MHRRASFLAITLLLALLSACAASPRGVYAPGITGPSHDTRLEVVAVDEDTHEAIDATLEIELADGTFTSLGSVAAKTWLDDAMLPAAAHVVASVGGVTEEWIGVTGSSLVIPIASRDETPITGSVEGAGDLYAETVRVVALTPARLLRGDLSERASPIDCAPVDGDRCTFSLSSTRAEGALVASLIDDRGRVIGFARVDALDGSATFALSDPSSVVSPITLSSALPTAPPGLDAVVGVPGLASAGAVAFLPSSDDGFVVPELEVGETWWVLAQASAVSDPSRRSVVLQRSLRAPSDVGAWPAWLEVPSVAIIGEDGLELAAVEGADLFVVEWLDAGRVTTTQVVLGAEARAVTRRGAGGTSVRVRAIDAEGVSGESLDLEDVERSIVRFSEVTLAL